MAAKSHRMRNVEREESLGDARAQGPRLDPQCGTPRGKRARATLLRNTLVTEDGGHRPSLAGGASALRAHW
jgi:hypothetical protein